MPRVSVRPRAAIIDHRCRARSWSWASGVVVDRATTRHYAWAGYMGADSRATREKRHRGTRSGIMIMRDYDIYHYALYTRISSDIIPHTTLTLTLTLTL